MLYTHYPTQHAEMEYPFQLLLNELRALASEKKPNNQRNCSSNDKVKTDTLRELFGMKKSENDASDLKVTETLKIDLSEYPDVYLVKADVPGFTKKDIELDFDSQNNTLTLKGTYNPKPFKSKDLVIVEDEENEDENDEVKSIHSNSSSIASIGKPTQLLLERANHGSFTRTVALKSLVLVDRINASITDGVLTVIVPKAAVPKKHKISIS